MKRIILQMLLLLCSIVVHGQDILDSRMCDTFKGKVKSITITSPEMMQSEVLFFPDGKIKFMKNASLCVEYEWKSNDELKLNIRSAQGSEDLYIYINEYRKDCYEYDMGEGNVKIWFRENGSLDRKETTINGNKMYSTYYYNNDSDLYPYKIENRMGTQYQTIFVNVEKYDSKGNAIEFTNSCNGITIQQKRLITYYE